MDPAPSIAIEAKLYLKHSKSTDVLTEEGRQINNSYLNVKSAYLEDGSPRMGMSREPADFAFIAYLKTKNSDINTTEGKNLLQALGEKASGSAISSPSSPQSGSSEGSGAVIAARNNSTAETDKGNSLNVTA